MLPGIIEARPEDCTLLYETLLEQSRGTSKSLLLVYPRQFVEAVAKYRDPTLGLKEFYDPTLKLDKAAENRETVLTKATNFEQVLLKIVSAKKYDLGAFFVRLMEASHGDISRGMDIDVVNDTAKSTFSRILSKEELHLFIDGLDANNSSTLEFSEIMDTLKLGLKDDVERLKAYFALTAALLDKKKVATGMIKSQ